MAPVSELSQKRNGEHIGSSKCSSYHTKALELHHANEKAVKAQPEEQADKLSWQLNWNMSKAQLQKEKKRKEQE